jgi:MGT family glycosyltransferase
MSNILLNHDNNVFSEALHGKKILFATFPADGHFNPLTGLAMHLKTLGCDVRWYTAASYSDKLEKLQLHHYRFNKALEVTGDNVDTIFPERNKIKGQVKKLKFDMINAFILRGPEYYADLIEIRKEFSFDLVVADSAFTGVPFISDIMNVPVVAVGVFPITETSKDLPPAGLGMEPTYSFFGRLKQTILRMITRKIVFGEPNRVMWRLLDKYEIKHNRENIFDMLIKKSAVMLQSGTPGFEYKRSDLSSHIHFVGAVLPYSSGKKRIPWFDVRLTQYDKIVLATQGTVERDPEKILVPTLDAFKNTDTLVIVTTGGSKTQELRKKFPHNNIIIEDFIPFADVMPYADAYITNGGYGGVMLAIENELPLVVAGVHEGKNEINARIGFFELGINLKTEWPKPAQMKKAVEQVMSSDKYKSNVMKLSREFNGYDPHELAVKHIADVLQKTGRLRVTQVRDAEKWY